MDLEKGLSEDPNASVKRIINVLTRNNTEWGSRAFQIYRENSNLDAAQSVEQARQELYRNNN